MMKRIVCALLTMTLLGICTGCFNNNADTPTTPTTTTVPRDTTTIATTTTTSTLVPMYEANPTVPTDPPPTDTEYRAETLPFSLILPASWQGHYAVREENNAVKFYELDNHLYDGSGHLFTVRFMNAAAYDDGMFPSYELLGEFGEQCAVALFPTDVQTSAEHMEAYNTMADDVQSILETFTYLG